MDISAENHSDDFASGQNLRASQTESLNSHGRLEALQPSAPDGENLTVARVPNDQAGGSSGGGAHKPRISLRMAVAAFLFLVAAAVSPFAWNYFQSYQSTDDAEIDGHIDPLSSRINGTVIAVHAEDDDPVHKGELLVEIDPHDFQAAADRARAQLDLAQANAASAKQDYAAALAAIRESAAASFKAQRDARRYTVLLAQQVVSQEQYDQYISIAKVDAASTDALSEAAGSAYKAIAARRAQVDEARAELDQALLNLSYTRIYAPADGIVGKRQVQLGSRIEPGQTLMFITETGTIWVTANFKETQLGQMRRGQRVTIHADTFGRNYQGYVENLPGASGDRFSLLPPENATGNYVKVVQRLPVRIRFAPGQDPEHLLHPGMSVEPKVWLR